MLQEEASRLEEKLMAHVLKYIGQVELIETGFVNLKDIISCAVEQFQSR